MGVVPALALAGVPMLVATLLAFHDGGYFVTSWGVASIVLWGVVVAGLVLMRTGIGGRPGLVAMSALPALAAWQGISSLWADEPSAAVAAMNLTLLYAAALAIGVVATGPGVRLAHVTVMGLAVTVIVAAAGVGARLFPDAIGGDELSRLNTPISYWNALGAVLAFGIVAAVGIGAAEALPVWARSLCVAATPLLSLGLYFTLSRGAILIVVVVLLALAAFTPRRVEYALIAVVAACASAVPVVLAARRELTSLGSEPLTTASEPRHQVALALVAATLICGAGSYTVNVALGGLTARPRRALAGGLAVAVVTAVVAGYVAYAPEEGPVTWADRQVESFQSYGSGERNDTSVASQLATAAGSGRWQNWSVAVDQFRSAPVLGTGAGDYRFWWNRERPISLYVVNAHSLYLEVLGESGLVGLVLLCVPLVVGVGVIGAARLRRGSPATGHELMVAACACTVIAAHAMGDWDWQLPAVVIPALVVGGAAIRVAARTLGWDRPVGTWAPIAAAAAAVVAVTLVAGPMTAQGRVDDARAAAGAGDLARALGLARDAAEADPTSPTPRLVQAYVLTDLGRPRDADRAFRQALSRSPRDWSVMADWAGSLITRREFVAAELLIERAARLNPREERVASLRRVLQARRAGASVPATG